MALAVQTQSDWGGGMFRQRKAPPDGCYDATNCLLGDDGLLFKRGGSAYLSTSNAGSTLTGVADVTLAAGQRTLLWAANSLWVLDGSSAPVLLNGGGDCPLALARGKGVGQFVAFPPQSASGFGATLYAGSRKTSSYSVGTVTVTNGSATLTGAGTTWTTNIDAGMILSITGSSYLAVVKSVTTNTSITLVSPWEGATAAGANYLLSMISSGASPDGIIPSVVGSAARRLLVADGNRVAFSARGQPARFTVGEYHELPAGANIVGIDSLQDTAILFTEAGIWQIANMALDPVDDFANQQHVVSRVSDLVLLDDPGVAGWQGRFVAPATDDIYLFSPGSGPESVTQWSIRALYRSYVKAGYRPGTATVFRGHYYLPIMSGTTVIDALVARLDRPHLLSSRPRIWMYPWTRWSGHAAGSAYATRPSATGSPTLLSISGQRVLDLTSTFDPTTTNAVEADGTTHTVTIESNDLPTGGEQPGFVKKARATYVLTDDGNGATAAPTVALAVSSDEDAGAYTTLTDSGLQRGGTAGAVSDGTRYSFWTVSKRRQRVRFKITQTGACASFVLRSFSFFSRGSGKQ